MNRLKPCYSFLTFFLLTLCVSTNIFGKSNQEMLEEHGKWLKILEITSSDTVPVVVNKHWSEIDRKNIASVYGKGFSMELDAETGEPIYIYNDYLSVIKSKEHDAGKRVSFCLDRETCEKTLAQYYKLITGEDPPEAGRQFKFPAAGTLISPKDEIGYTWPRIYKGYAFHYGERSEIRLYADDGVFKMYIKRYTSTLPPSIEVKIKPDVARQKAVEVADKEIRNWIHFLDSPSATDAFLKMSGAMEGVGGNERRKKMALENFASQKQESRFLLNCTPEDVKPPYLEITNLNNTYNNNENRNYWDGKPEKRNLETRLSWVVTLRYTSVQFEVWIDAKDGSLVGGYRPW